ncbi:MAG: TAXI family TRAP transporter solute-binding subunit [Bacteroidota bacterium]
MLGRIIAGLIAIAALAIAGFGAWQVWFKPPQLITLTAVAGPRGSDSFRLLFEISEVLKRHSPNLRLQVKDSRNSSVNISLIQRGAVDLGTIASNTPAVPNVNLIAGLFPDYFLIIAREGAGITTVNGLAGRKIAVPEAGSPGQKAFWSVIDHYGMAIDSFRAVSSTRLQSVNRFLSGEVDAVFFLNSIRDPLLTTFVEEAGIRRAGLRFIEIDQSEAMALKRPFLTPQKMVKGAFNGTPAWPDKDIVTTSLNRLLVANEAVNPEAIQELTRIIFEHRLDLLIRMPLSAAISVPDVNNGATLPVHPGAMRYYDRDKPSFLQENAEPMALIVTLIAMLASAGLAVRRSLQARAKNRGDDYNQRLLSIAKEARAATEDKDLIDLQEELDGLLETVVHALDTDRITQEAFRSFSFLWSTTKNTVTNARARLSGPN